MSKQTGLGDNLYVGGFNLSGDIQALPSIHGGPAALDMTPIDKFAFERQGGKRDGAVEATSFFNPDPGRAHLSLSALPNTDLIISYLRGTTLGAPAASLNGKQANYAPNRAEDGALTVGTNAQSNAYGLEWGHNLSAGVAALTSAGNLTGFQDVASSSAFGFQAYLHVFAFTGTSATVNIQHSSDNGAGDAYSTVASFGAVSGIGGWRIETDRDETVESWLRVNVAGSFSLLWLAVIAVRNEIEVLF